MIELNSNIYLFYYLLLWVVVPATSQSDSVFISEIGDRTHLSVTNSVQSVAEFQQCVNPDWNKVSSQESQQSWLSGTGHWAVLFSSIFKAKFRFSAKEILNPIFSNVPILGSLTTSKIIFPFHYFW